MRTRHGTFPAPVRDHSDLDRTWSADAGPGCLCPGIQTTQICLVSVISGSETGRDVELSAVRCVRTRRTGRCRRQKNRIPLIGAATPPARLRAARTAPVPGAFREIDRNEIPRDRSFRNIFLEQMQTPAPGTQGDRTERSPVAPGRELSRGLGDRAIALTGGGVTALTLLGRSPRPTRRGRPS